MMQIRITVFGNVQGVFFRKNTLNKALELGLTGRVWNNPDGTVGMIAQGHENSLKTLLEWTKNGEGLAKVEKVIHEYSQTEKIYEDFLILR